MSASLLEQLKSMTVVVADTGDIHSIRKFTPRDATTNPSLITAAAQMPEYQDVVRAALDWARRERGKGALREEIARLAVDRLAVEFGLRILRIVPGRVSTEVDARLSHDTGKTLEKARFLIELYQAAGAKRERILIKIASTWEGIRAAEVLEKEGIHCNLTLLFGMHQAVACAEAGATLISPFVGRILDWHLKETGKTEFVPEEDPGVVSVTRIYNYYKKHDHRTEVMGASFRNIGEILELAGCDLLTIAPKLLSELATYGGELERKLDPKAAQSMDLPQLPMSAKIFREMHESDRMARDKLAEGIEGFAKAQSALEGMLMERMKDDSANAARDLFRVFDLDGDGFITREEWSGTDAVFDALDENGDGRITAEEMGAGLGAAFRLQ
ncbi:MAG: transaldolase [Deltaproteobacteria bacterium]|nr:MAG: transaldolase [Deltaproteobacteria bacterium]